MANGNSTGGSGMGGQCFADMNWFTHGWEYKHGCVEEVHVDGTAEAAPPNK